VPPRRSSWGDIAVYDDIADRAAMFASARLVLKDGRVAVRDGRCTGWIFGRTHALAPSYDGQMVRRMETYLIDRYGVGASAFAVPDAAFGDRDVFRIEATAS
jgi:formylmethanofuran dehydrogenase subunit A